MTRQEILDIMRERILILDGATGTYLQGLNLTEEDFRGERFKDHPVPLKGCNDVLCLTKPEAIIGMHRAYIEAGADIIETNSFNANRFSLADYEMQDLVYEISKAAAECARRAIETTPTPNPSPRGGEDMPSAKQQCGTTDYTSRDTNDTILSPSLGRGQGKRLIIAGSIGPTNRTLSMSGDVNNPAHRDITFEQLYNTYHEQARGLIDGGADILLVETIFDTLNAKAALKAITDLGEERGLDIPIMCSGTLSDASGRTLSGQTVEAYCASLTHGNLLSIGLNCGFGAKQLLPWLRRLSDIAPCPVSVHPNAGLPNVMGGYDETPETFAEVAKQVAAESLVNIYGGCCGTSPAHIKKLSETLKDAAYKPRPLPCDSNDGRVKPMVLSGLEALRVEHKDSSNNVAANKGSWKGEEKKEEGIKEEGIKEEKHSFYNIGERTNVAGSAKFKKLIQAKDYETALTIARNQVDNGAHVIDICMDDGLIDGVDAMTTFLNLIASEPEIARVPVMIDSSKWEILKAGLQCVQGKSIVNSFSLKEGEEKFLAKARYIHSMGAATVVMLFDEEGQADSYERKVTVARRAYKLLKDIGFPTEDIIFDPNVLAVATGMPEHDDYGRAFIAACATIHKEMPEVHMSGGISNLSFSFRGNNKIRQAMHSVVLHHAIKEGLDMSIVNPAMTTPYEQIPEDMLTIVEDVVLNRKNTGESGISGETGKPGKPGEPGTTEDSDDITPSERLIEYAEKVKAEEDAKKAASGGKSPEKSVADWRKGTLNERIEYAMLKGMT
ncbi:MAG: homocysteine S-methyltransferase family protein, partial [Prevotella sp.]|nr:homocysteine S-methyltransferase family protein [Prevotella sp.]